MEIITLDNKNKYALLDEININKVKYYYAIKLEYKTEKPSTEYEILEEEKNGKDVYMNILKDGEIRELVLAEFANKYINFVNEINQKED